MDCIDFVCDIGGGYTRSFADIDVNTSPFFSLEYLLSLMFYRSQFIVHQFLNPPLILFASISQSTTHYVCIHFSIHHSLYLHPFAFLNPPPIIFASTRAAEAGADSHASQPKITSNSTILHISSSVTPELKDTFYQSSQHLWTQTRKLHTRP